MITNITTTWATPMTVKIDGKEYELFEKAELVAFNTYIKLPSDGSSYIVLKEKKTDPRPEILPGDVCRCWACRPFTVSYMYDGRLYYLAKIFTEVDGYQYWKEEDVVSIQRMGVTIWEKWK